MILNLELRVVGYETLKDISMKNYKDLKIYQLAFSLSIEVHHFSLELPKIELFEQGSQLRRSSKSIKDNIAEGYGRRRYKSDFIRFLVFAHASCDETINHLETIKQIYRELKCEDLLNKYDQLGRQLNSFIKYVENNWNSNKLNEDLSNYELVTRPSISLRDPGYL